ncbi:tRNA dihydrouridine synthase DusB [Nocardioidaceae bacterium]|nr:tRNA dihydrouridine synthase DusB [Nocardioidaceae bacterium]
MLLGDRPRRGRHRLGLGVPDAVGGGRRADTDRLRGAGGRRADRARQRAEPRGGRAGGRGAEPGARHRAVDDGGGDPARAHRGPQLLRAHRARRERDAVLRRRQRHQRGPGQSRRLRRAAVRSVRRHGAGQEHHLRDHLRPLPLDRAAPAVRSRADRRALPGLPGPRRRRPAGCGLRARRLGPDRLVGLHHPTPGPDRQRQQRQWRWQRWQRRQRRQRRGRQRVTSVLAPPGSDASHPAPATPTPTPAGLPGPLRLGTLEIPTPVVLAPMAGITNAAYRRLCRESGAGLYVCEMITSRGLVEGDETTRSMLVFDELEDVRSVQLYGTDPHYVGEATRILCGEYGVAHVDLNFGCPVPKVTRKGGGAALPWKADLLAAILGSAVEAAAAYDVPVTMKTRLGIDADHLTYLDAGRAAQESGAAAIALHGRTAQQAYAGHADWEPIGELVSALDIPVLGNGDIWEAEDALRMTRTTGAAGVVVGRGCLGRPWLFRDLAAAFAGEEVQVTPPLGHVADTMRRHAELLVRHTGSEERGCKEFRKHVSWYLKGFPVGSEARREMALVSTLAELDAWLATLDRAAEFPRSELGTPRGRQGSPRRRVALPEGWLDDRETPGLDAEDLDSGSGG